eukprot:evm.model.scf_752.4 EVM.evm.TU.scf_752.4   scf_752:26674-35811(-)
MHKRADASRPPGPPTDGDRGTPGPETGGERSDAGRPPRITAGGAALRFVEVGALLTTGTSLALLAQVITNMAAADPKAQLLAWVKYLFACLLSGLGGRVAAGASSKASKPVSAKTQRAMLLLGVVDTFAYSMNCIGFAYCGSAWASVIFAALAPTFTALMSRFVLRKQLQKQQILAVGLVVAGLLTSAVPRLWSSKAAASGASSTQVLGALAVASACLSYSTLGVLYEKLIAGEGDPPSHSEVVEKMTVVGLACTTGFQVVYTWPKREALLLEPLRKTGTPLLSIILVHVLFGAVFALHTYCQSRVFRSQGAIGVGIVGSVRGAAVTAISAALFCSPAAPHQCLSLPSAVGSIVVTGGGIVWATAGKGRKRVEEEKEKRT